MNENLIIRFDTENVIFHEGNGGGKKARLETFKEQLLSKAEMERVMSIL